LTWRMWDHALCGLFLRSFDGLSQCVRSAMSGIFTGSVMFARDLLETSFLISFLMSEPGRPEAWLKADARTVKRTYAPLSIRKALDDRDGFFEMKRKAHYDRLSQLTHPTPFALDLKRDGQGLIHSGPIKQIELLKACLEEAAIASILLGECLLRYCRDEVANGRSLSSRLSIALQRTREVYLKR
ncbi:hypothetical protein, partial [Haematobacter missouriensis]|uniref:hypothetical protein n=1 Tax=Haematobacter missouriensis TaxID=366616 RepID=UPI001C533AB2